MVCVEVVVEAVEVVEVAAVVVVVVVVIAAVVVGAAIVVAAVVVVTVAAVVLEVVDATFLPFPNGTTTLWTSWRMLWLLVGDIISRIRYTLLIILELMPISLSLGLLC